MVPSSGDAFIQSEFSDQLLKVLLIKHLNIDVRVDGSEQPDFAVLLGNEGLLHRGDLDVSVELGKVEVRGERLENLAVLVPLQRKAAWLIFPANAVKIEQIGE